MRWRRVVILGGSGFCGAHLAEHLVAKSLAREVVLVDLVASKPLRTTRRFDTFLAAGSVTFQAGDVRAPIEVPDGPIDLIANFAAIHREPGHREEEYWATNIPGAKHACQLAEQRDCREIIFASSTAPYESSVLPQDETSTPAPPTAYGASKLEAEQIHRAWQLADPARRRLAIVRPGVVFGPGEGGNVSRMVRALVRHRFAYVGSRRVRKAGIYVGDFVRTSLWALARAENAAKEGREATVLANLTIHPAPSVEEYAAAICAAAGIRRRVPTIPVPVAVAVGEVLWRLAALTGRASEWHPERIAKLARPNQIVPQTLIDGGYEFAYTLHAAMREWKDLRPDEWR